MNKYRANEIHWCSWFDGNQENIIETIIVQTPRVSEQRETESWKRAVKTEGLESGS